MSETLTIAAEPRTVTGKQVKQLRRDGLVPAVIYGQQSPVNIQLERTLLYRVLRRASTTQLVNIEFEGKVRTVLAREIQQHATRGDLIHVDFLEVNMKETITSEAAVEIVGEPGDALKGLGTVVPLLHVVEIECLPGDLISEIQVDASAIQDAEDIIYVSDLRVPDGVTILADPETVVATFQYTQTSDGENGGSAAGAAG